jgi:hypothetical protein
MASQQEHFTRLGGINMTTKAKRDRMKAERAKAKLKT